MNWSNRAYAFCIKPSSWPQCIYVRYWHKLCQFLPRAQTVTSYLKCSKQSTGHITTTSICTVPRRLGLSGAWRSKTETSFHHFSPRCYNIVWRLLAGTFRWCAVLVPDGGTISVKQTAVAAVELAAPWWPVTSLGAKEDRRYVCSSACPDWKQIWANLQIDNFETVLIKSAGYNMSPGVRDWIPKLMNHNNIRTHFTKWRQGPINIANKSYNRGLLHSAPTWNKYFVASTINCSL